MKERKLKNLKYEETSVYNENGELTSFSTSSGLSPYSYSISIDPVNSYRTTTIVDPADYSKLYNPGHSIPYTIPYTNFEIPEFQNYSKENETIVKRKEIVDITRMNTMKEILDRFEKCVEFIDIYKLVEELKKEYKLLAGIEE